MAAGKAYGEDREYQVLCKNILQATEITSNLVPYSDDGIDIKFENLSGTDITFDVVLSDPGKSIVVAECRRQNGSVKQEALFSFARKVESLRKQTQLPVAGLFFTKRKSQIGAIRHASWSGIKFVILAQDQSTSNFVLSYQRYDALR